MSKNLFNVISCILLMFVCQNVSFALSGSIVVDEGNIQTEYADNDMIRVTVPILYTVDAASVLDVIPTGDYLSSGTINGPINKIKVFPTSANIQSNPFVKDQHIELKQIDGAATNEPMSLTLSFEINPFGGYPKGMYHTSLDFRLRTPDRVTTIHSLVFQLPVSRNEVLAVTAPVQPEIDVPEAAVFTEFAQLNKNSSPITVVSNSDWWLYLNTAASGGNSETCELEEVTTMNPSDADVEVYDNEELCNTPNKFLIAKGTPTIDNTTDRNLTSRMVTVNYTLRKRADKEVPNCGPPQTRPITYTLSDVILPPN